jgi:nucleotide-binding universal stress UspA family protein
MEFRHILFPVDFSRQSYRVVPHVRAMADRFDAAVTLHHVMETAPLWAAADDGAVMAEVDLPTLRSAAEEKLHQFAIEMLPGMPTTELVAEGQPGLCIAKQAKERGSGMVMLPTHGHGALRNALLATTTSVVLHDSGSAVWTASHVEQDPQFSHLAWKRILCAVDLVPESVGLIQAAAELGKKSAATVGLVHAIPGSSHNDEPFDQFLADHARDEIAKLQAEAGTNFEVALEAGDVAQRVRETAFRQGSDVVIIGRGAARGFGGRLRTHAWSIIRDSPCPVLSL